MSNSTCCYTDGSFDLKQNYAIQDIRGPLPTPVVHPHSILGVLASNPNTTAFTTIVKKTLLAGILNDPTASFTLFAPIDSGVPSQFLDLGEYSLLKLLDTHLLIHAVPKEFMRGSKGMLVNTRATGTKLFIETRDKKTMIERYATIIGSELVNNGRSVIYYTDKILPLTRNPLAYTS